MSLVELLETIGPKLANRPAERAERAGARSDLRAVAEASPLYASAGWYREWVERLGGRLTEMAAQGEAFRLTQAVQVLEHLESRPADAPPVALAELAAMATRDTKALDRGTRLSTLVLGALAICWGVDPPVDAEGLRELWSASGVVVDDLASRVLVLNLPAEGDGLGEWLTGAARLGTPFQVTLHQLNTLPIRVALRRVFVCENPAVLRRAAGDLGAASAALVCTEGMPSAAFHHLARAIIAGGGELHCHGDFDWPGVAITGALIRRYDATPWRMSAADYRAGLGEYDDHRRLGRKDAPTPWDADLARAMSEAGAAVYEEAVADRLLADLTEARAGLLADRPVPRPAGPGYGDNRPDGQAAPYGGGPPGAQDGQSTPYSGQSGPREGEPAPYSGQSGPREGGAASYDGPGVQDGQAPPYGGFGVGAGGSYGGRAGPRDGQGEVRSYGGGFPAGQGGQAGLRP